MDTLPRLTLITASSVNYMNSVFWNNSINKLIVDLKIVCQLLSILLPTPVSAHALIN